MIILRKMVESEKPAFRQANIDALVAGLLHYKRAEQDFVVPNCEAQIDAEIAHAEQTDYETFLSIVNADNNEVVGSLWYRLHQEEIYTDLVFVCWLGIYPNFRRSGFARAALTKLGDDLKPHGIHRMALQAFNHSIESMNLYESSGFEPKRTILHKYLE